MQNWKTMKYFLALLFLAGICTKTLGDDWPGFHGPNGDNISAETGLLERWSPEDGTPKLIWKIEGVGVGENEELTNYSGYSSPAICGNRIVLSGNFEGISTVFCYDTDGNKIWSAANGPEWTEMFPGTRGTPYIDGEHVYDESPLGNILCLKLENGELVWERNLLDEYKIPNLLYGRSGSILIRDSRLFVSLGGETTPAMLCLDPKNGKTIWESSSTGFKAAYGTPCFFKLPDGREAIAAFDAKGLFVLDAKSGELFFHFIHRARLDENISTPIYHAGSLFLTNGAGSDSILLKLKTAEKVYEKTGQAGISVSYEEVWENKLLANSHGGVVLIGGKLYGSTNKMGGGWACIGWDEGENIFLDRKLARGSVCSAGGLLYILSEFGELILAKPGDDCFEVRGRLQLPGEHNGQVYAHPVICDKRLYVRIGDLLYCFDVCSHESMLTR